MTNVPSLTPLIDTHVHFFDLTLGNGLRWSWLDERSSTDETLFDDLTNVRTRRFSPRELRIEASRLAQLQQCIHIQSALGSPDSVEETRWVAGLREEHGLPGGHVAYVRLGERDALATIDAHRAFDVTCGVRDPGGNRKLSSATYAENVRYLGEQNLVFEIFCSPRRYDELGALAAAAPDTQIVLEHFGLPGGMGENDRRVWRRPLQQLAEHGNVWLKLSGLGMIDADWTMDAAQRLVREALEVFGPSRCIVGSNWPIDRSVSSYPDVVLALASGLAQHDLQPVLHDNAMALYGLSP